MNRIETVLTNDEIRAAAPSAFAIEPWQEQSSRYAFVPTSQVIEGMRSAGFMPVRASQSRSRIPGKSDFTKHQIRFRDMRNAVQNLGDHAVEAVLVNSHDGTSTYELSLGVFRLACLNGLMVAEGMVGTLRIKHLGDIVERVVNATSEILLQAPVVSEAIRTWKDIRLSNEEQLILAQEAHGLRFDEDKVSPEPTKLLMARRREDTGSDLWTVFNRIQENVVKGGIRTYDAQTYRRNKTRAVTGIDQNAKLNRALWSLGQKMAELKGVAY